MNTSKEESLCLEAVEDWERYTFDANPGTFFGITEPRKVIDMVYERHQDLIEHWQGWRFTAPFDGTKIRDTATDTALTTESARTVKEIETKLKQNLLNWASGESYENVWPYLMCTCSCGIVYPFIMRVFKPMYQQRLFDKEAADRILVSGTRSTVHHNPDAVEHVTKFFIACYTYDSDYHRHPIATAPLRDKQSIPRVIQKVVTQAMKAQTGQEIAHGEMSKLWAKSFAALGDVWAVKKRVWDVVYSAAPLDILRLGHYGEKRCCYRNGTEQEVFKHALIYTPGSMVVLLKTAKGSQVAAEGRNGVAGRCWGVGKIGVGAVLSNVYLLSDILVKAATKATVQEALAVEKPCKLLGQGTVKFGMMCYPNNDDFALCSSRPEAMELQDLTNNGPTEVSWLPEVTT